LDAGFAPYLVRIARLSTPLVRQHYLESIEGIEADGLGPYLVDAFPRYVAPARARDPTLWETFRAMASRLRREVVVRQMRALLNYRGFPGNLREIVCPTVLICGDEDQRTPVAIHQEMAEQISGSQLRVIDRYGHFTPLEQKAVLGGCKLAAPNRPFDVVRAGLAVAVESDPLATQRVKLNQL
jgi:pimeloyl-ACP methyl ester carboxylesterase